MIFRYILQQGGDCIAVSIHLSEYLKVCALGAKGKMNNGQAWIPEDGGQSRQTSARLREGFTPGPDLLPRSLSQMHIKCGSPLHPLFIISGPWAVALVSELQL